MAIVTDGVYKEGLGSSCEDGGRIFLGSGYDCGCWGYGYCHCHGHNGGLGK
jgi:hypothetical protein